MKKYTKMTVASMLTTLLVACSSGDETINNTSTIVDTGDTTSGSIAESDTDDSIIVIESAAPTAGDDGLSTDDADTTDNDTVDTTGQDTTDTEGDTLNLVETDEINTVDESDATSDATDDTAESETGITPSGRSLLGNPPILTNPTANAIQSPNSDDPFGTTLEVDNEAATAGGAPTTPKNLRVDLVSNDWAEFNWAPSNDDVGVVEYRIYRSDGHVYNVTGETLAPGSNAQRELDKFWQTTSFIDCNYTRFFDVIHNCGENGPAPGDIFSYQVSAVDGDGQESPRSNSITINYHQNQNAEVPRYDDYFKRAGDSFAQDHDLSNTAFFLDKFEMVFEDNFDGTTLDETKWNTALTWGDNEIINGEQQYFVDTQNQPGFGYTPFRVENGELIIEAIQTPPELVDSLPSSCNETDPSGNERCQFLSGALSSHDKFGITYGYVEGRMQAGDIPGMLSSFYMYHRFPGLDSFLHGPEIDILEYLGENPFGSEDAFQTYHYVDNAYSSLGNNFIRSAPTMSFRAEDDVDYGEDYHTFGMLWEPQLVIWYIDGQEVKRLSGVQVARQQMNIVTYLVAGSEWAPTPADDASIYPLQFKLDYIRAYQRPEFSTNGVYP